jgi:hypothetical protein
VIGPFPVAPLIEPGAVFGCAKAVAGGMAPADGMKGG